MSKMSELSQVLEEMIVCGEGMIKAANTLKDIFSSTEEAPAKTDPAPTYTKEDVRGVLAAKSAAGFKKEVKDLLEKFGAQQLKQIDPKDYAEDTDVSSITSIMGQSPAWMPDILIRGDGYETKFYKKD